MFPMKFDHTRQLSAGVLAGVLIAACILLTSRPAWSEWEVVNLHPPGAGWHGSEALAIDGQTQGGWLQPMSGMIWSGSALSASTLPTASSVVWALQGKDKAGTASYRAALWVGSSNDYVDLHQAGAVTSAVYGMYGNTQAGEVSWDSLSGHTSGYHASIWNGTADSWQDLSPVGSSDSHLAAIDASGQVGRYRMSFEVPYHAGLWYGTAESVVDLHPAGAYASQAQAISNGRQGGWVQLTQSASYTRAAVWSGTAGSYQDITPATTFGAQIYGMAGDVFVGEALFHGYVPGQSHAVFWSSASPDACLDLHTLLSSDYTNSFAYAVDVDEFGTIRVVGYAYNNNYYLPDGTHYPRNEAMMWVLVPEPSSLAALAAGLAALAKFRWRR